LSRRIVYLPSAQLHLDDIYDLIAEDSPRAAFTFIEDIRRRCEPLADFPRMGRSLDGVLYRMSLDRRVSVYYAFDERSVWISAVRYLGQNH
jgi:plasmid stabilization system protein ParE